MRDRSVAAPQPQRNDDLDVRRRKALSRMMDRVIEELPAETVFETSDITLAIRERSGSKLRRQPDPRSVATTLRRWSQAGHLVQAREGRAHSEGLFRKKS